MVNSKSRIFQQPLIGSYSTSSLSLYEQTIYYKSIKGRQLSNDDDLKIFKEEYLRNHLLDHNQILN